MVKAGYQRVVVEIPQKHHVGFRQLALKRRTSMATMIREDIARRLARAGIGVTTKRSARVVE